MEVGNLRGQLPQGKPINNAPLAIVLHMCGVPFLVHEGIIYPGFNFYSDRFLKDRGYEGKERDSSIQDLFTNRGMAGQLVFLFERKQGETLIDEICVGWEKQSASIKAALDAPAEGPDRPYKATETLSEGLPAPDIIAAICCQFTRARKDFYGDRHDKVEALWRRRDRKSNRLFMPVMKAKEGASRTENEPDGRRTVYGSINLQEVKV